MGIFGIDRIRAPSQTRRYARKVAGHIPHALDAGTEVDMTRRNGGKGVGIDTDDRIGNDERADANPLDIAAGERLGRNTHDGDIAHKRRQHDNQVVIRAHRPCEAFQIEPGQSVAAFVFAHGHHVADAQLIAASPVQAGSEHSAAFRARKMTSCHSAFEHRIQLFVADAAHAVCARVHQPDFLPSSISVEADASRHAPTPIPRTAEAEATTLRLARLRSSG
ncbi:MAG: hypothetical protein ACLTQI_02145 [Slackia sp.]